MEKQRGITNERVQGDARKMKEGKKCREKSEGKGNTASRELPWFTDT